jgi:hypothetical protein
MATTLHLCDAGNDSGRRCSAPLVIHSIAAPEPDFTKRCAGVNQASDSLAGRQAAFGVLSLNCLFAAPLKDLLLALLQFGRQVSPRQT